MPEHLLLGMLDAEPEQISKLSSLEGDCSSGIRDALLREINCRRCTPDISLPEGQSRVAVALVASDLSSGALPLSLEAKQITHNPQKLCAKLFYQLPKPWVGFQKLSVRSFVERI